MKITINNKLCYVKWQHVNNVDWNPDKMGNRNKEKPLSYTSCAIVDAETHEELASATAYLGKKEKHFNKEKGRKIAFRKVLNNLNLSKSERKECWLTYFKETKQLWILYKISKDMNTVINYLNIAELLQKLGIDFEILKEKNTEKTNQ